jgi:hypothetical protein
MTAYTFMPRFVPLIESGRKSQTIRKDRSSPSRHARVGEAIQLYTGMRTPACRLIGEARCIGVTELRLELPGPGKIPEIFIGADGGRWARHLKGPRELEQFAKADGFSDFDDMHAFWLETHGRIETFHGVLIRWEPLK